MDFLAPPPSRQRPPYLQRWARLQPLVSPPCQWSCHLQRQETSLNEPWMDLVDLFCFTCRRSFTCCLSFKYVGQLKAELGGLLCLEGWIKLVTLSCCYGVYIIGGSGTLLDTNQGYISISENSYTWKTVSTPSGNSIPCVFHGNQCSAILAVGCWRRKRHYSSRFFPQATQKRANDCLCCTGIGRIVDVLFLWKLYYNF